MYCKNCGAEIKENQKFCPKCGAAVSAVSNDSNMSDNLNKGTVAAVYDHKKLLIILGTIFVLLIAAILIAVYFNNPKNIWNEYLEDHQIDNNACDFTFYIDEIGGNASNFSYEIGSEKVISSQIYDIDSDGKEELLQITIKKDNDNIKIYPSLQITEEDNGTYKTEEYNFNDSNYYISTLFDADYYIYKSDKNTYVIVEKDEPGESGQYCAASVIDESNSYSESYYFVNYDDGTSEVYDIGSDERVLARDESGSDFYISEMSNLRMLFSDLGINGFLTGTDDIDNIKNYDNLTLIGQFSVDIDGNNGRFKYNDLLEANK